jgi:hypothetical protein
MKTQSIPHGDSSRLWLYTDFHGSFAFARDMNEFRKLTRSKLDCVRVVPKGGQIPLPKGYRLHGEGLAFDGIERIPTMRSLIHALTS